MADSAVPVSAGLLGGVAAAIIVIIAGLILGFVLYRRNTMKKQKLLLEEYSQQLQMVCLGMGGRVQGLARTADAGVAGSIAGARVRVRSSRLAARAGCR